MNTAGMIRSVHKIKAVIKNEIVFTQIQEDFGSFSNWIWSFTDNMTYVYKSHDYVRPAHNDLSDKISLRLNKMGMKYLGSVTVYAHLQASGIINDHDRDCMGYSDVINKFPVKIIKE